MNKWWCIGLLISYLLVFAGGAYFMYDHMEAGQLGIANKQTVDLGKGEQDTIKFNQNWKKAPNVQAPITCKPTSAQLKLLY